MGKAFTLYGKKQKLNHASSMKTDTLKCHSCEGSTQCERTSFLASFTSSAGKKNISRSVVAEVKHFQKFQISKNEFC